MEAPQQRLQDLQEGAGDRALVLARLAVAGAPGAARRPGCGPWRCGPAARRGRGRTPSRGGGGSWHCCRRQVQPVGVRDRVTYPAASTGSRPRPGRAAPRAASCRTLPPPASCWLWRQTSSVANMTASSRAAWRGRGAAGWVAVIGRDGSDDVVSATRLDGHSSGVPWLGQGRARQARARASPWQEIGSCETGLSWGMTADCRDQQFPRPRPDVHGPPSPAGFGISRVLGSAAPRGTPRIGAVVDQLARRNRVAPRADRCGVWGTWGRKAVTAGLLALARCQGRYTAYLSRPETVLPLSLGERASHGALWPPSRIRSLPTAV